VNVLSVDDDTVTIQFTDDELNAICTTMNEALNAILSVAEFSTRTGIGREFATAVHRRLITVRNTKYLGS